jgi:hypothetical protein
MNDFARFHGRTSIALGSLIGLVALSAGCGLAVAACGGGGSNSPVAVGTNPNSSTSPLKLSECMRANGVSNFPDPSAGPGGSIGFNGPGESNTGVLIVDGRTFSGPAVKRAEVACKSQLPPSGPPPALTAAQFKQRVAFARCMRTHGVPSFPDPTAGPGGGAIRVTSGGGGSIGGVKLASPAFQRASQACGNVRR